MTRGTRRSGDYDVGYGRPPMHSRWPKGRSGNPSGRRRRPDSLRDKLRRLIGEEIVVRRNGEETVMTQEDAMLLAVMAKAMKGDLPAARFVSETVGIDPDGPAFAPPVYPVGEADLAALGTHVDWMGLLEAARAEAADDDRSATPPNKESDDDDSYSAF